MIFARRRLRVTRTVATAQWELSSSARAVGHARTSASSSMAQVRLASVLGWDQVVISLLVCFAVERISLCVSDQSSPAPAGGQSRQ